MGVNINAIDKGECTPLYQAVHGRCGNCVRLLIQGSSVCVCVCVRVCVCVCVCMCVCVCV